MEKSRDIALQKQKPEQEDPPLDKKKILSMVVILSAIVVIAGGLTRVSVNDSMSLAEYASLNASKSPDSDGASPDRASSPLPGESQGNIPGSDTPSSSGDTETAPPSSAGTASSSTGAATSSPSSPDAGTASLPPASSASPGPESSPEAGPGTLLTGASLNGSSQLAQRTELADGFYYEPISDKLRRYMTGISFPAAEDDGSSSESGGSYGENGGSAGERSDSYADGSGSSSKSADKPSESADKPSAEISFEELRYVHILHYNFDGLATEGELVCNEAIAQDLMEIFYELYRSEYQLERVLLIDEYNGDDEASMEDNNTSCFNYRPVAGSTSLSKHALGLAVDINPLYNPYITYTADGKEKVSPPSALPYADRSAAFPYKIDGEDLCCKLFLQHGFTWGGNWNNVKDYQHFQKSRP